ncbi:hypothetical protein [Janthinobacterium lividum]|uniref:hypothetical protein n=1 Tax=Janthinobacterium lividum TaxID=29581 RepID=UPI0015954333|nr:hypothetical protein [Janthinobacterium lividum]QKY12147.1 hypothetical protein G8765_30210 [Janthinobacterium lividum]
MQMEVKFLSLGEQSEHGRVLVARGPTSESNIVASVLIAHHSAPVTRVNILASAGYSCFQSTRFAEGIVYIGFGQFVFVVDLYLGEVRRHQLDGYFAHLYDSRDLENLNSRIAVLVTSASEVLAFDHTGGLIWEQSLLGIDGVVLHDASAGQIRGDGEWDPPSGWRPFSLVPESGAILQ